MKLKRINFFKMPRFIILASFLCYFSTNAYTQVDSLPSDIFIPEEWQPYLIPLYPERIDSLLNQDDVYVYTIAEEPPYFNYKNAKGFIDSYWTYLEDSLRYPSSNGCHGKVFVEFIVEKDGTLNNINVVKGISDCPEYYEYNKEAIRVFLYMPKWTPGKIASNNVRVSMILPVVFN